MITAVIKSILSVDMSPPQESMSKRGSLFLSWQVEVEVIEYIVPNYKIHGEFSSSKFN